VSYICMHVFIICIETSGLYAAVKVRNYVLVDLIVFAQ